MCNSLFKGSKSLKNLEVGVIETDFKQVPFVFRQTTCTYSGALVGKKNDTKTQIWVKKIFPLFLPKKLSFFTQNSPPTGGVKSRGGQKMTQKPKFGSKIFPPNFALKNIVSLLKIDFD